jgi:hypothetical protein
LKALEIYRKKYGESHLETARIEEKLGNVYLNISLYEKA